MTLDGPALVAAIFIMRVANYAIGTLRLIAIARGRRLIAATLASLEALVFALVIAGVIQDLENLANLAAYCAGAAAGSWVGMELESRLIRSYMIVNIFSPMGEQIAKTLRESGFGVTLQRSEGKDGEVITLRSVIDKRDIKQVSHITRQIHPEAFLVAEEVSSLRHGWFNVGKGRTV
ncbi:MAG: hypothetical protein CUN56_04250 [Phototrophicales bacterium]|nr:MAG: hypothetical protein CUN56_04250 [Phototrophicales bacterium]RMG75678.1 MAG: hypothetical protein D6711_05980 [Chloroflexota bacterium]